VILRSSTRVDLTSKVESREKRILESKLEIWLSSLDERKVWANEFSPKLDYRTQHIPPLYMARPMCGNDMSKL